jgi:hypothetical protein
MAWTRRRDQDESTASHHLLVFVGRSEEHYRRPDGTRYRVAVPPPRSRRRERLLARKERKEKILRPAFFSLA